MRPLKCEAPPGCGGASQKLSQRAAANIDNSELSFFSVPRQGPHPLAKITDRVFLGACERQVLRQIEKLSNPAFGGTARIEASEYLAALLVTFEEAAGHPWTPAREIAA